MTVAQGVDVLAHVEGRGEEVLTLPAYDYLD
jgi:hypothetical protein